MRLTYCFAIFLMQIIFYAKGDESNKKNRDSMDIKLETKEVISRKDTDVLHMVVTVTNKDGTPFNGQAEIILFISQDSNPYNFKTVNCGFRDAVNGKAEYNVNMTEVDFQEYNNAIKIIEVWAYVHSEDYEDSLLPDRKSYVKVYSNRYNLNRCISGNSCLNYTANLEQDVVYQITHVDGSYVNDTKSLVELTYNQIIADADERSYQPRRTYANQPLTFTAHMNETGCVHFKVKLTQLITYRGTRSFVQKLKYLDEESKFNSVHVESVSE